MEDLQDQEQDTILWNLWTPGTQEKHEGTQGTTGKFKLHIDPTRPCYIANPGYLKNDNTGSKH